MIKSVSFVYQYPFFYDNVLSGLSSLINIALFQFKYKLKFSNLLKKREESLSSRYQPQLLLVFPVLGYYDNSITKLSFWVIVIIIILLSFALYLELSIFITKWCLSCHPCWGVVHGTCLASTLFPLTIISLYFISGLTLTHNHPTRIIIIINHQQQTVIFSLSVTQVIHDNVSQSGRIA